MKFHMHVQYHKKHLFAKEKTFSSNNALFFSMNDSIKNMPRSSWDIQVDWENDL